MTDKDLISCIEVFNKVVKLNKLLYGLFETKGEYPFQEEYNCQGILYDLIIFNTIFPNGQEEFPFEEGERMCDEFAEIMFNDILSAEHKLTLIKQIKK